jgi:hypothetical protein
MAFEYRKQPWEEEVVGVDFSRRVPSNIAIEPVAADVTWVSIEETVGDNPNNYAGHLRVGEPSLTGAEGREKILAVMITGGVSEFKYRVSFRVTLSDGQKKEDDVWVTVKES